MKNDNFKSALNSGYPLYHGMLDVAWKRFISDGIVEKALAAVADSTDMAGYDFLTTPARSPASL